jgi:hypothetical protein
LLSLLEFLTIEKIIVPFHKYILYQNIQCIVFSKFSNNLENYISNININSITQKYIEDKINELFKKLVDNNFLYTDIKLSNIMIKLDIETERPNHLITELLLNDLDTTTCVQFDEYYNMDLITEIDKENYKKATLFLYNLILYFESYSISINKSISNLLFDILLYNTFLNKDSDFNIEDILIEIFYISPDVLNFDEFESIISDVIIEKLKKFVFIKSILNIHFKKIYFQNIINYFISSINIIFNIKISSDYIFLNNKTFIIFFLYLFYLVYLIKLFN